jgi:hypothetical protein
MSVTYFVALPFIDSEEGLTPAEAQSAPTRGMALLNDPLVRNRQELHI